MVWFQSKKIKLYYKFFHCRNNICEKVSGRNDLPLLMLLVLLLLFMLTAEKGERQYICHSNSKPAQVV